MKLPFDDFELFDQSTGVALIRPCAQYLADYRLACEETWNHIHNRYILHDPDAFDTWKDSLFATFEKRFRGEGLPDGYYPSLMLWGVRGERFVGAINIRLEQDESLLLYGGTFGYFVRTALRGQGCGTALGRLGLLATQRLDIRPLAITCQESNAASMAVSEHLPYLQKERYLTDVDGVIQPVWRYWLPATPQRDATPMTCVHGNTAQTPL